MPTEKQKRAIYKTQKINDFNDDKLYMQRFEKKVKKSNIAVQKARYDFSLQQQKLLCYMISFLLSDTDTEDTEKILSIRDYLEFMGSKHKDYTDVRAAIKAISDKSWYMTINKDGDETPVRFIDGKPIISHKTATVKFKWDRDMLPHLQELRREYTEYKLWYIITMKSEYTVRLYEYLKSVQNLTHWQTKIDYLKHLLECKKYSRFFDFKKRVLVPAITEINERTDINVTFECFKFGESGRSYTDIEFTIEPKSDISGVNRLIYDELYPDQCEGQQTFDDITGAQA